MSPQTKTIQETVAEKIVSCGDTVKSVVVDNLVQIEVGKRVDLVTRGMNKLDSLTKDLAKIDRNDVVTYSDGIKTETMSKNRYEEIAKLKTTIGELSKDFSEALESNTQDSYNKLSDKLKKLDGGSKETNSAEAGK